jgi:glucose-6-phosphate 1-epimerase
LKHTAALAQGGAWLLGLACTTATATTPATQQCLAQLRPAALAAKVQPQWFDRLTQGLTLQAPLVQRLDDQPEFTTPIWDYLAVLVDAQRVDDGAQRLATYASTLAEVQQRFGVDPATVVAVWGIESDYGRRVGTRPVVESLLTLSCIGRRQNYFRTELFAAMRVLQTEAFAPEQMLGSWAGAFGQTQFMPSTYERLAVDGDGDGKANLVNSAPDALASTAHFLKDAGWQPGQPWGIEVAVPAGRRLRDGRRWRQPLEAWIQDGLQPMTGASWREAAPQVSAQTPAALLRPAGEQGPAWLVFANFHALYRYNAAESYALALGLLSDALQNRPPPRATWPTDDLGLSRAQRRELQTLLTLRGHDIGAIDGALGKRSRQAIRAEQQRLGLPVTGRAGQRLLHALR